MTTCARGQPFCRKYNINIGYYDGFRICPRNVTQKIIAFKKHNNNFCSIWKSFDNSFNKAIEELKNNFKVVDNVIFDKR